MVAQTNVISTTINMDDLLCLETVDEIPNTPVNNVPTPGNRGHQQHPDPMQQMPQRLAARDSVISEDKRVINNLLENEFNYVPNGQFLNHGMSPVNHKFRRVLINWIMDLCEHEECELQVFFVAVNLLDRFLSTTIVNKNQLQLSACACMLISSKIRQSNHLHVDLLAYYTEDSVTADEIRQWEVLVLAKLSWDTCPVTTFDYVDPLLEMIPEITHNPIVRRHTLTYLALAHCDADFVRMAPSVMTVGALLVATEGLRVDVPNQTRRLATAINGTLDMVLLSKNKINKVIDNYIAMQNMIESSSIVTSTYTDKLYLEDAMIAKSNELKVSHSSLSAPSTSVSTKIEDNLN